MRKFSGSEKEFNECLEWNKKYPKPKRSFEEYCINGEHNFRAEWGLLHDNKMWVHMCNCDALKILFEKQVVLLEPEALKIERQERLNKLNEEDSD